MGLSVRQKGKRRNIEKNRITLPIQNNVVVRSSTEYSTYVGNMRDLPLVRFSPQALPLFAQYS